MDHAASPKPPPRSIRRPPWLELLRLGGAFAISLLLWEGILRLTVGAPAPFVQHPRLGWVPKPFASGFNGREGWSRSTYNELGFRDQPLGAKVPGEFRILCLGDSYTEGGGMTSDRTFPKLLEKALQQPERLRKLPGSPTSVRVINAGRAGTTMAYSAGLAETYRELVEPDWVVLQVRDYDTVLFDPVHEFRFERDGDDVVFRHSWHQDNMGKVKRTMIRLGLRESAVFKFGLQRAKDFLKAGTVPRQDKRPANTESAVSPHVLLAVDRSVSMLRKGFPRLVVVHIPYGSASAAALVSARPEEVRLLEDCERESIPVIPMRGWIDQDFAVTRVPPFGFANTLPWSGHPNQHGNQLIADALFDYFTQLPGVGESSPVHGSND